MTDEQRAELAELIMLEKNACNWVPSPDTSGGFDVSRAFFVRLRNAAPWLLEAAQERNTLAEKMERAVSAVAHFTHRYNEDRQEIAALWARAAEWLLPLLEAERLWPREEPKPGYWRVGAKVPLNVYQGDQPVCQCHTKEDAYRIVAAVNGVMSLTECVNDAGAEIIALKNRLIAETTRANEGAERVRELHDEIARHIAERGAYEERIQCLRESCANYRRALDEIDAARKRGGA